jgi:hypothetical protein
MGQKKYVGSWAEDLQRRQVAMDAINQGMLFAATLLLCLFPFLIVASALADPGLPYADSAYGRTARAGAVSGPSTEAVR